MNDEAKQTFVTRKEHCTLATVRRVAAMLDLNPDLFEEGQLLPRGWHFVLMGADSPRSEIRGDGFAGLGITMPDLGLPRLLQIGRSVHYSTDLPVGSEVIRKSSVENITEKVSERGPMAVASILHEITVKGQDTPSILEKQTYLLLGREMSKPSTIEGVEAPSMQWEKEFTPDDLLLFHYSALGFNSHKIHIDRDYAKKVEGYPDLVVNGGLTSLILTEFLRNHIKATPKRIEIKYKAPLFCGRRARIGANQVNSRLILYVFDEQARLAAEMEVELHEG